MTKKIYEYKLNQDNIQANIFHNISLKDLIKTILYLRSDNYVTT